MMAQTWFAGLSKAHERKMFAVQSPQFKLSVATGYHQSAAIGEEWKRGKAFLFVKTRF